MGLISKIATGLFAAAGLAVFSQAPEFAQQYRQRLAGSVEELRIVVSDFDRDAANSSLSRNQALQELLGSATRFARDRGASMRQTIDRFARLGQQQLLIEKAHPLTRPLFVLRKPDAIVLGGSWKLFEPALPLTVPGSVWGGIGGLLAAALARFGIGSGRKIRHRRAIAAGLAGKKPKDVYITAGYGDLKPGATLPVLRPGGGPIPQRYPPSLLTRYRQQDQMPGVGNAKDAPANLHGLKKQD